MLAGYQRGHRGKPSGHLSMLTPLVHRAGVEHRTQVPHHTPAREWLVLLEKHLLSDLSLIFPAEVSDPNICITIHTRTQTHTHTHQISVIIRFMSYLSCKPWWYVCVYVYYGSLGDIYINKSLFKNMYVNKILFWKYKHALARTCSLSPTCNLECSREPRWVEPRGI